MSGRDLRKKKRELKRKEIKRASKRERKRESERARETNGGRDESFGAVLKSITFEQSLCRCILEQPACSDAGGGGEGVRQPHAGGRGE